MSSWWDINEFPDLGRGSFDALHAFQAISETVLKNPQPGLFDISQEESFKGAFVGQLKEFRQIIESLGGRHVFSVLPTSFSTFIDKEYKFVWDNAYVDIAVSNLTNEAHINVVAGTVVLFDTLCKTVKVFISKATGSGRFYTISTDEGGMTLKSVGVAGVPLVRENYVESVLKDFDHIVEDLQTDNPCGRCIILDGNPGAGKSFLIRALLNASPKTVFINVPPNMVAELGNPSFINVMLSTHRKFRGAPMAIVVEDADAVLVTREADNMSAISSLLNISDGLLGSSLNIRVIATTNAGHMVNKNEEIDEAILRPGRLCRKIHVPKLPIEQANAVYKKLTGEVFEFSGPTSIAEIYLTARTHGKWTPPKEKKTSFGFTQPDIY